MVPLCLIVNPVAGRGAGERAIPIVTPRMARHGLACSMLRTERPWHAAELARQAAREGYSVVVAVGDDGTANEVLNGLMQARLEGDGAPSMGALCVGRGNDFAFAMVSIMNGRRMGGGFRMAPGARCDDGWLDLCIASQVSRPQILALIPRFMQGTQASHPAIQTARARRVTVTALQGSLPAHADGETLCTDGRELSLEIVPAALEIVSAAAETAR